MKHQPLAARVLRRSLSGVARGASAGRLAAVRALRRSRVGARRVIVLDPGLIAPGGHHYEFAHLLRTEFGKHDRVTIYGHAAAGPIVAATLDARPLFRDDLYPPASGARFAATAAAMTASVARSLGAIDPGDLQAETLAVMHTTTVFQLGGLAEWYQRLAPARRPKLCLQFQHPLEFMVEPHGAWPDAVRFAREAAGVLASAGVVRFAANAAALATRISEQLGQPCALLPVPVRWPRRDQRVIASDSGVVFGFFGGLREEKGAALLASAVATFAERFEDARFIIHAPRGHADIEAVRILEGVRNVELLRKPFNRKEAYYAAFRRARWLLLPYDPRPYALRTSGIFLEALGLGIPVVVTPGTWMAAELSARGGRGLVMRDYSTRALIERLAEARLRMLAAPDDIAIPNPALIAECSSASFCDAIGRLIDR